MSREQAWPAAATCQIDFFARVLDGSRPNVSGASENLAHQAFIAACYASAQSRQAVDPKELLR